MKKRQINERKLQELENLARANHVFQVGLNPDSNKEVFAYCDAFAVNGNDISVYFGCSRNATVPHDLISSLRTNLLHSAEFF